MIWPWDIPWNDQHDSLADHFGRYGRELRARTPADFVRMAHQAMRDGEHGTFRRGPRTRVGYYHERTRRFVVPPDDESMILSLSRQNRRHVEQLPDWSYQPR